ncbi:MAG TPA: hypothetical protein PKE16_06125 [Hyphomicrobium sp.]|nr:hypothetical protein [Hyphomicrobium sp.]
MKTLIIATVVTTALAAAAMTAHAQDETDKAMGAGSYIHPNGATSGAWSTPSSSNRYSGAGVTAKKHKAR